MTGITHGDQLHSRRQKKGSDAEMPPRFHAQTQSPGHITKTERVYAADQSHSAHGSMDSDNNNLLGCQRGNKPTWVFFHVEVLRCFCQHQ